MVSVITRIFGTKTLIFIFQKQIQHYLIPFLLSFQRWKVLRNYLLVGILMVVMVLLYLLVLMEYKIKTKRKLIPVEFVKIFQAFTVTPPNRLKALLTI